MENGQIQSETNIGAMRKRRVKMADGRRYLIYYTFEKQSEPPAVAGGFLGDAETRRHKDAETENQEANPQSAIPNPQSNNPPATAGGSDTKERENV